MQRSNCLQGVSTWYTHVRRFDSRRRQPAVASPNVLPDPLTGFRAPKRPGHLARNYRLDTPLHRDYLPLMAEPPVQKSFLVQRFAKIPLGNPVGSLHLIGYTVA